MSKLTNKSGVSTAAPARGSWWKYVGASLALCIAAGVYWQATRGTAATPPQLEVAPETLDMGTRWVDTNMPWTVTFRNPADEPLDIVDIRTTCQCLVVTDKAFRIPPHGSTDVRMQVNLNSSTAEPNWKFAANLRVYVSGERRPREWTLAGDVRRAIDVSESRVRFGRSVVIGREPPPTIIDVQELVPLGKLTCSMDANYGACEISSTGKGAYVLKVTPSQQLPAGVFDFDVLLNAALKDDGVQLPPVKIICNGTAISELEAIPSAVGRGTVPAGETLTEIVQLRSVTGAKISKVDFQVPEGATCAPMEGRPLVFQIRCVAGLGQGRSVVQFTATIEDEKLGRREAATTVGIDYHGL